MITSENSKQNVVPSYKMSDEERLDITNQLKDAIALNKAYPQKKEWDSNDYRKKYGL